MIKVTYFIISNVLLFTQVSGGLNLGLISGDLKKTSNPFIIKKTSHHSPITINIKREIFKSQKLLSPRLPPALSLKSPLVKVKIKKAFKSAIKPPKLLKVPKS